MFCHNQPVCFKLKLPKNTQTQDLQVELNQDQNSIWTKNLTDLKLKQRRKIRFCLDEKDLSEGKYSLLVSSTKEKALETSKDFRVASESEEVVVEIRAPQKILANGETILRAISRNCSAVRERPGKNTVKATRLTRRRHVDTQPGIYQWASEDPSIDLTDCEKSRCPVNGLVGGQNYSFHVTEVIPLDGKFLETQASTEISVASIGNVQLFSDYCLFCTLDGVFQTMNYNQFASYLFTNVACI